MNWINLLLDVNQFVVSAHYHMTSLPSQLPGDLSVFCSESDIFYSLRGFSLCAGIKISIFMQRCRMY